MMVLDQFSFKEKSIFISMVSLVFIYGAYFLNIVTGQTSTSLTEMLYAMIGVVVSIVVVQVVLHIVLAIFDRPGKSGGAHGQESGRDEEESDEGSGKGGYDEGYDKDDERDRVISGRASRASHLLLSIGVILVIGRVVIRGAMDEGAPVAEVTLYEVANLLLFFLVLSEVVHYSVQLLLYRRGVRG